MLLVAPVEGPVAVSIEASRRQGMSKRIAKKGARTKALSVGRKESARLTKRKSGPVAKGTAAKSKSSAKSKVAGKRMTARAKSSSIVLPPDYRPSEDEPFM